MFVIGLGVLGVALTIAIRLAKPATGLGDDGRGGQRDGIDITGWQRMRSGVLLATLVAALGAAAALVLLVAGTIIVTGLRTAVQ